MRTGAIRRFVGEPPDTAPAQLDRILLIEGLIAMMAVTCLAIFGPAEA